MHSAEQQQGPSSISDQHSRTPSAAAATAESATIARNDLSALYPDLHRDEKPEDAETRFRREHLAAKSTREADREMRSQERLKQTLLEFTLLFLATHWLFHGLTTLTFGLNLVVATALAFAIERWFLGRFVATFLAVVGYGIVLQATGFMMLTGMLCSIILITCGTQMLRITREAEWQSV